MMGGNGQPGFRPLRDIADLPPEAWRTGQGCRRTHAANLPGIIETSSDADFRCASCGHDLGVRGCQGCCKQRFADIFESDPCAIGGDVDHGCCHHDAEPEAS